ncbi:MAG TPA: hypothetical protein VK157_00230 [Phycisphaerales bacterium]|nr:hypothetical protein [Phycisphaerales bacterium]
MSWTPSSIPHLLQADAEYASRDQYDRAIEHLHRIFADTTLVQSVKLYDLVTNITAQLMSLATQPFLLLDSRIEPIGPAGDSRLARAHITAAATKPIATSRNPQFGEFDEAMFLWVRLDSRRPFELAQFASEAVITRHEKPALALKELDGARAANIVACVAIDASDQLHVLACEPYITQIDVVLAMLNEPA